MTSSALIEQSSITRTMEGNTAGLFYPEFVFDLHVLLFSYRFAIVRFSDKARTQAKPRFRCNYEPNYNLVEHRCSLPTAFPFNYNSFSNPVNHNHI
jgi:hypothetical protein